MLLGIIVFLCRDESVSAVFVFVSDELFDFIDSDTLIDLTAGPGIVYEDRYGRRVPGRDLLA